VRGLHFLAGLVAAQLLAAVPACAQTVTSPAPDKVAVTIYRDPDRAADAAMNRGWLRGYALVTERRRVRIPAGRATIRFEGVAAGILPESAIVTGLPQGVREKNLDADLLSPLNLYARSFGRPVILRRTVGKSQVEEPAVIRSGPDGGVIVQTRDGFRVADCGGPGSERLVYRGVPADLPARPTLSIETDSPQAGEAVIALSYLAWGFDWQANYVATMHEDPRHADLFAWVTLASSDTTSFPDAETMVIAGKVQREDSAPWRNLYVAPLEFHCFLQPPPEPAPPPPPPPASVMVIEADDIGRFRAGLMSARAKAVTVVSEELGDLKAYRVPDRTTVAAMAQKQVGLLARESVPVDVVYCATLEWNSVSDPRITLRAVNRKEKGLGLPLPAGRVAVFAPQGERAMLVGEGHLDDKAVGEDVEVDVAPATQVTAEVEAKQDKRQAHGTLTVRNANSFPVRFEAIVTFADDPRMAGVSAKLGRKNGQGLWAVTIPANASKTLRYRLRATDDAE